jgi:hypothetical protein
MVRLLLLDLRVQRTSPGRDPDARLVGILFGFRRLANRNTTIAEITDKMPARQPFLGPSAQQCAPRCIAVGQPGYRSFLFRPAIYRAFPTSRRRRLARRHHVHHFLHYVLPFGTMSLITRCNRAWMSVRFMNAPLSSPTTICAGARVAMPSPLIIIFDSGNLAPPI